MKAINQLIYFCSIFSVSTLEKTSKTPLSPLDTSSNIVHPAKVHDDTFKISTTSVASDSRSDSYLANSLDSDDDHFDKLTGPSSTSSFLENKRIDSFDGSKPLIGIIEQIRTSNTSLNRLETDVDLLVGHEMTLRYRGDQQNKESVTTVTDKPIKIENESKVFLTFHIMGNFGQLQSGIQ